MSEPRKESGEKRPETNARECTTTVEEGDDELTLTTTCRRPVPPTDEKEPEGENGE